MLCDICTKMSIEVMAHSGFVKEHFETHFCLQTPFSFQINHPALLILLIR